MRQRLAARRRALLLFHLTGLPPPPPPPPVRLIAVQTRSLWLSSSFKRRWCVRALVVAVSACTTPPRLMACLQHRHCLRRRHCLRPRHSLRRRHSLRHSHRSQCLQHQHRWRRNRLSLHRQWTVVPSRWIWIRGDPLTRKSTWRRVKSSTPIFSSSLMTPSTPPPPRPSTPT